jgi:hypothetical protein
MKTWKRKGERPFDYEVMWETHENFSPMLKNVWHVTEKSTSKHDLHMKLLKVCVFVCMGANTFESAGKEIKQLNKELEKMKAMPSRVGPSHDELKTVEWLVELRH